MKNRNLWIVILVILVIFAGVLFWTITHPAPVSESPTNVGASSLANPTEDTSPGSVNSSSPSASMSYASALEKYKNARLQLDNNCRATPSQMTFKNGSYLMVDNRSSRDRIVKVGSSFNVKAFSFKIIKLSSSKLPATWLVDCDQSQNVATIIIQK